MSLNEGLDAINNNATVTVTATVEGDQLVVTDNAGGAGTLTISDAPGDLTATDLGIARTAVGGEPLQTAQPSGTLTDCLITRAGSDIPVESEPRQAIVTVALFRPPSQRGPAMLAAGGSLSLRVRWDV